MSLEGIIKSVAFGVACSLIAVYEGYHAEPTAEGVGLATTRTVVASSVLTLLLDYILTAAFLIRDTHHARQSHTRNRNRTVRVAGFRRAGFPDHAAARQRARSWAARRRAFTSPPNSTTSGTSSRARP